MSATSTHPDSGNDAAHAAPRDADLGNPTRDLTTPPLAVVAAVSAVVEVCFNRFFVRGLSQGMEHADRLLWAQWGAFPRNLVAIAGVVSLVFCLVTFLRTETTGALHRRISLAGFTGIFVPSLVLATIMSPARTSLQIIIFAAGAANVLAVLMSASGARWSGSIRIKSGLTLVLLVSLFALTELGVFVMFNMSPIGHQGARWLRLLTELAWLTIPLAFLIAFVQPWFRGQSADWRQLGEEPVSTTTWRRFLPAASFVLVTALTAFALAEVHAALRGDYQTILYGAFRTHLFIETNPRLYLIPLSLMAGLGAGAAVDSSPLVRQMGLGLILVLCAGISSRAPVRLVMMALGAALMARAALSEYESRRGRSRPSVE